MERKVELVNTDDKAIELGEGRRGLNALSTEPAQGVTIVPDVDAAQSGAEASAGPTVSASDAEAGPSKFDG